MRDWKVFGFEPDTWEALKKSIEQKNFCTCYSDFFGNIYCGALDFDIVLRDAGDEWLLCADAYILGEASGYGYTPERNTPYDQGDQYCLEFDLGMSYEETLKSFIEQVDKITREDLILMKYADKTEPKWEDEYDE